MMFTPGGTTTTAPESSDQCDISQVEQILDRAAVDLKNKVMVSRSLLQPLLSSPLLSSPLLSSPLLSSPLLSSPPINRNNH